MIFLKFNELNKKINKSYDHSILLHHIYYAIFHYLRLHVPFQMISTHF